MDHTSDLLNTLKNHYKPHLKLIENEFKMLQRYNDFYFSTVLDGYSVGYNPNYPEKSKNDLSIWISDCGAELYEKNESEFVLTKKFGSVGDLVKYLKSKSY